MRIRPEAWLKGLVYATFIAILYHGALHWLVTRDWSREDYSSSALIPLVVIYLIWEKRHQLAELPSVPSWKGMIPFGFGLVLFWLGELAGEFFTLYLSLWLVVAGLCWTHLGWRKLKIISFPVAFSLAMFPLPGFINTQMTLKLKLLSSQLGVGMLQLFGMTAFREGNVIDMGFTRLQVVDACSGLRYLVPLIAMAVLARHAAAYVTKHGALVAPYLVLMAVAFLYFALQTMPGDLGLRLGVTGEPLLQAMPLNILFGGVDDTKVADSGLIYLIANSGMIGFCVYPALASGVLLAEERPSPVAVSILFYILVALVFGYAPMSIKTASVLGYGVATLSRLRDDRGACRGGVYAAG